MDMTNSSIGSRIMQIRKERGYTREQLAEYADISADFLWEVETGRKSLKVQNLGKIAVALDVSTDFLILGTTPYKENAKLNTMISALPEETRKQAEKLVTLFVDSVRIGVRNSNEEQNKDT